MTKPKRKTPDSFGRVAVLMGGCSAEREVSLKSGSQVLDALLNASIDAFAMDYQDDLSILLREENRCDRAFIAMHGRGGEDGVLQGVLESLNIPYTGSGVMASALAMDKKRTKYLWEGMSLPTPRFGYVTEMRQNLITQLVSLMGFPLAVKPSKEGSSIGVHKVNNQSQLEAAISDALQKDDEVLLEQWIEGSEYTIAILGEDALPVIGLKTEHVFYDYDAKYESNDTQYLLPSGLGPEEEKALQNLALRAFKAVGCRGWGRVDVMRDSQGRFWLLEVNTIPGMTNHSLVPMAANAAGMSMEDLVVAILDECDAD